MLRKYRDSPDQEPSDYHLCGFVKNQMRGQHYKTKDALQTAVRQCLRAAGTEFDRKGIFKIPERWGKCVQRNGDYVDKFLLLSKISNQRNFYYYLCELMR